MKKIYKIRCKYSICLRKSDRNNGVQMKEGTHKKHVM